METATPVAAVCDRQTNGDADTAPLQLRHQDLVTGAKRLVQVLRMREMFAAGLGVRQMQPHLGAPVGTVYRWWASVRHIEQPTAADLAAQHLNSGCKRRIVATVADTAVLAKNTLITNRTADSGSVEEAARIALRRGELSPELTADFKGRIERGQTIVTEAIRREVMPSTASVKQYRNPTDAALDYLNAPGSTMWITDSETGEERFIRAMDILEADDATINFHAVIPWTMGGCPCSEKHQVKVGRFQLLLGIDAATRFIAGYSYTARPRSSYRAEDIVSLLRGLFRQHGVWKNCRFERGAWESNAVKSTLELLGVGLHTVWSPHQKPYVEGVFNTLWTKLSAMPGQTGRFMGEQEETDPVFRACLSGAKDPRNHFPMLTDVLAALDEVIAEKNATRVKSAQYGEWIPAGRWQTHRSAAAPRLLDDSSAHLFAPCVRSWKVKGNCVGGSIAMMEGFSLRYDFSAPWLTEFHGCQVKVHFDPHAADDECIATIVLEDRVRDHNPGELLGTAVQVNKSARYGRKMFGYGDDSDNGLQERKAAAQAMRRTVRAIVPDGSPRVMVDEVRDGLGNSASVERGGAVAAVYDRRDVGAAQGADVGADTAPLQARRALKPGAFDPVSPEVRQRRRSRFAEEAQISKELFEVS